MRKAKPAVVSCHFTNPKGRTGPELIVLADIKIAHMSTLEQTTWKGPTWFMHRSDR